MEPARPPGAPQVRERPLRVLVAVDDTPESVDAARVASFLFGEDAEYAVVSVGSVMMYTAPVSPLGIQPALMMLTADSPVQPLERAEAVAADVARQAGVDGEIVGDVGDPGRQVCELAAERHADVIVIGSHERGLLDRLLGPSVQSYVVDHAPCPVVVVR